MLLTAAESNTDGQWASGGALWNTSGQRGHRGNILFDESDLNQNKMTSCVWMQRWRGVQTELPPESAEGGGLFSKVDGGSFCAFMWTETDTGIYQTDISHKKTLTQTKQPALKVKVVIKICLKCWNPGGDSFEGVYDGILHIFNTTLSKVWCPSGRRLQLVNHLKFTVTERGRQVAV